MKNLFLLFLTLASLSIQAKNGTKQILNDTLTVTNKNVTYNFYEDNTYVYLNINISDKNTSMAVLRNGLTIYFDIKGKKRKDVYIKYPYKYEPKQSREKPNKNDNNTRAIDFSKFIENMPSEAEYGYYDNVQQFHKDLNSQDISLNYGSNEETLEFSLKIPKKRINNAKEVDFSKLSIGILTNKLERKPNNARDQNQGAKRGGRARKGGGKPGRSQRGKKGRNSDTQKEHISIDFWFDVNLENE